MPLQNPENQYVSLEDITAKLIGKRGTEEREAFDRRMLHHAVRELATPLLENLTGLELAEAVAVPWHRLETCLTNDDSELTEHQLKQIIFQIQLYRWPEETARLKARLNA